MTVDQVKATLSVMKYSQVSRISKLKPSKCGDSISYEEENVDSLIVGNIDRKQDNNKMDQYI